MSMRQAKCQVVTVAVQLQQVPTARLLGTISTGNVGFEEAEHYGAMGTISESFERVGAQSEIVRYSK